jgi:hypothetical protein
MKKIIILAILMTSSIFVAQSQNVRLNLYTAYAFDDQFDSYYDAYNYYDGKIEGGFQWGGGLEFMPNPEYGIEFLYLRQDTKAPTRYLKTGYGTKESFADFDLGINYIMLAGQRHIEAASGKVDGFAGLMGGVAVVSIDNPDNGNSDNVTKFSWGLKGGANIWLTNAIGIKLQAQLLSISQAVGGGVYFGTGGSGAAVSSYSTVFQFTLGGGLAFRFGQQSPASGAKIIVK